MFVPAKFQVAAAFDTTSGTEATAPETVTAQSVFRTLLFCLLLTGFSPSAVVAEETITLYSYHRSPPFITTEGEGLTCALADYLTRRSRGEYRFQVKVLPRKRLDLLMAVREQNLLIPRVTPICFGPGAQDRYTWTDPVLQDGSIYIWKAAMGPDFSWPEDLRGFYPGGISGYRYVGVDPLVEAGEVL